MLVVVSYDVATADAAGRKRLRMVAAKCRDFGQRVQNSVFECEVDPGQWARLRGQLISLIDPGEDRLRFYLLGRNWRNRIESHGMRIDLDIDGPLVL